MEHLEHRRKRNSSKINLIISFTFHTIVVVAVVFLAAREGILGKKLKELTVTMAPKEKKPEPPKPKVPEPKLDTPKPANTPKLAVAPPPVQTARAAAPPPVDVPAAVAPAAAVLPDMTFNDGAREVQTVSDPNALYKGLVEHALRSRWNRPEDMADDSFIAEVELSIDAQGNVTGSRWLKGSGNSRWDNAVKSAVAATKVISRPPPKGFPAAFVARFDVESLRTEEVAQLNPR
ncbi:MAG TPA: TonB family protein [Candidatus Binatia bacterium]|jgi:TonB family protein|nr:TonB family protein [Candidatus Binatia bacterium]